MPLFIISSSISNVYFEKAKDLYQSSKKELFYATRKIIGVNIIIILAFLVLINTVGVYILELFLNKTDLPISNGVLKVTDGTVGGVLGAATISVIFLSLYN